MKKDGRADMNNILNSLHNFKDLTDLKKENFLYLISNQDKVRFVVTENKIKATHGHTIEVKKKDPIIPLDILYQGTSHKYIKSIFLHGLLKIQSVGSYIFQMILILQWKQSVEKITIPKL
jgi:RNA:NAD 2'-phosphotransferase (TPT1/KptA family)